VAAIELAHGQKVEHGDQQAAHPAMAVGCNITSLPPPGSQAPCRTRLRIAYKMELPS